MNVYALRLQITTRCQLRCGYCRPAGLDGPEPEALTVAEAARLVGVLVRAGVRRVRLTGGEPLVRKDAPAVVAALKGLGTLEEINLTTNGELLAPLAATLKGAGLTRVNVHIDSLDPDRYHQVCGGDLRRALQGLDAAIAAGLSPKINVVVQRGINDDQIDQFCHLAHRLVAPVRFIELMDTGAAHDVAARRYVPAYEVHTELVALGARRMERVGSTPAVDYRFFGSSTRVGLIGSVSEPFCESCDRLRLSADGTLRTCLWSPSGTPLGAMARAGLTDDELLEATRVAIAGKTSLHPSRRPAALGPPRFSMATIGG